MAKAAAILSTQLPITNRSFGFDGVGGTLAAGEIAQRFII